jgi:hypothetical protein
VANHADKPGGAVPPLAIAHPRPALEPEIVSPDSPPQIECRQRFRGPWRLVFVAGVERISRLCVLMYPILPGLRSIWTWPAKTLNFRLLRTGLFRGTQEVKLRTRQFTNRRMRTFIAAPSARKVNNTEEPP